MDCLDRPITRRELIEIISALPQSAAVQRKLEVMQESWKEDAAHARKREQRLTALFEELQQQFRGGAGTYQ